MRLVSLALFVLLTSAIGFGQAQTNLPATPKTDPTKDQQAVPIQIDTTDKRPTPPAISPKWFTAQSDQLLQILSCLLSKKSIENQEATEKKAALSTPDVVAARIKLVATLVQKNARNQCQ